MPGIDCNEFVQYKPTFRGQCWKIGCAVNLMASHWGGVLRCKCGSKMKKVKL